MSDMIWNGSYTLGNSQETQITAGTGIKVTTPAAGQIQIAADETVLWTGTVYETGTDYALSETVKNFSKIEVWVQKRNGTIGSIGRAIQVTHMVPTFTNTGCLSYVNAIDIASNAYTQNTVYIQYDGDGTAFRLLAGTKFANGTFSNNISTYDFVVTKIIGISRIA